MRHVIVLFRTSCILWGCGLFLSLSGCRKEDLDAYHYNPSAPLPMRVIEISVSPTPTLSPETTPSAQTTPTAIPSPTAAPTATPTPAPRATRTPTPKLQTTITPTPTLPPKQTPTLDAEASPRGMPVSAQVPTERPSATPVSEGILDVPVSSAAAISDLTVVQTPAIKPTEKFPLATAYGFTIDSLLVCSQVTNRTPEGCNETFSLAAIETIFTWIKLSGVKPPQIIKHVYIWEGNPVVTVNLKLQYTTMRTWSQISIKPEQIGKWKVNILTEENKLLTSQEWTVTP